MEKGLVGKMTDKKQSAPKPSICENCGATKEEHWEHSAGWMTFNSGAKQNCNVFKGSKLAKRMGWE